MTKSLRCEASIIYRQGPDRLKINRLEKIKNPNVKNVFFIPKKIILYASFDVFDLDFIFENFWQAS